MCVFMILQTLMGYNILVERKIARLDRLLVRTFYWCKNNNIACPIPVETQAVVGAFHTLQ